MIPHLAGALERERLESGDADHKEVLDERLFLPHSQKLVINRDIFASSLVRLGMIRIGKNYLPFIGSCGSIDPIRYPKFVPRIQ